MKPKPGYFHKPTGWVKATLIAGPYTFHNAVRVKLPSGVEVITGVENFRETSPKMRLHDHWAQKRAAKAMARAEYAAAVIAAIGQEKRLGDLMAMKIDGEWVGSVHGKICCWQEFDCLQLEKRKGKVWITNPDFEGEKNL